MKEIAILGSTGSIGTQALEVIRLRTFSMHRFWLRMEMLSCF